jgi:hypothetical protein
MAKIQKSVLIDEEILQMLSMESKKFDRSLNWVINKRLGYFIHASFDPTWETVRDGEVWLKGGVVAEVEPPKKIATRVEGAGTTEGMGTPGLPPEGKAQIEGEMLREAFYGPSEAVIYARPNSGAAPPGLLGQATKEWNEAALLAGRPRTITGELPRWSEERMREMADAEPGGLMACSPDILGHMLEDAKFDAATAAQLHLAGVELDREILVRWGLAENYKPRTMVRPLVDKNNSEEVVGEEKSVAAGFGREARAKAGKDRRTPKAVQEDAHGAQGPAVGDRKPGIDMQALRDICAGKLQLVGGYDVAPICEVDLCGFKSYNDEDGEWYVCGKEKHDPKKSKHGGWIKI